MIEEPGLSVAETARILRVRRATISDLMNDKAALSPEMALRMGKAFGVGMGTLLGMQALHAAARMRAISSTNLMSSHARAVPEHASDNPK